MGRVPLRTITRVISSGAVVPEAVRAAPPVTRARKAHRDGETDPADVRGQRGDIVA